jgi:hypothetical protein
MLERMGSVDRRRWSSPLDVQGLVSCSERKGRLEARGEGESYIIIIAQSLVAPYRRIPLIHVGSSLNMLQVPLAIGSVLS